MAENGTYYGEHIKQEPMSPVLYQSESNVPYENGIRGDSSDISNEIDSNHEDDAPIDFSLRTHKSEPKDGRPQHIRAMATNLTENVDSTSPSPTSNIHYPVYYSGRPPANNDPDSESSSSSSSYNLSLKERVEQLAANSKRKSSALYSDSPCLPHLTSVATPLPPHLSPNSTIHNALPPMIALCDQTSPNVSLKTDSSVTGHAGTKPAIAQDSNGMHLPLNYFGLPGFAGFHSITPGTMANINKTTEELYEMYKNQLQKIQTLEAKKRYRGLGSLSLFTGGCPISPPTLSPEAVNQQPMSPETPRHMAGSVNSTGVTTTSSLARRRPRSLPDEQKDDAYWERRRKNNEAAKRSRDTRRAKEDEIAIRAALLEQENMRLRVELAALKTETAKLRYRLYNGN